MFFPVKCPIVPAMASSSKPRADPERPDLPWHVAVLGTHPRVASIMLEMHRRLLGGNVRWRSISGRPGYTTWAAATRQEAQALKAVLDELWDLAAPITITDARGVNQPPWGQPVVTPKMTLRDLLVQGFREVELTCKAGCGWSNRQTLDFIARRRNSTAVTLEEIEARARCRNCDQRGATIRLIEPSSSSGS